MFMHEKGITGIDSVPIDLNAGEHRAADYRAKVPVARVPALELDDGRVLSETRAICSYLEACTPSPI
jgi:glutathione S-transferase